MATHYSRNIKTFFKKSKSVKSIKHIDVWEELHGEQREWWDRHHLFPKELSIYDHGKLVRSTKWYLNGLIKLNLAVIGKTKIETSFYSSGRLKYRKTYKLMNKEWVRHDIWYGYYHNGIKNYAEKYNFGILISQIRFFPNGNIISKFTLENKQTIDSSDTSSISSIETEEDDSSVELTEKIFSEEYSGLKFKEI